MSLNVHRTLQKVLGTRPASRPGHSPRGRWGRGVGPVISAQPSGAGEEISSCTWAFKAPPHAAQVCLKAVMSHKSWKGSKSRIREVWPLHGRDFKSFQLKGQVAPSALGAGCASVSRPLPLGIPWFPGPSLNDSPCLKNSIVPHFCSV